MNCSTWSPSHSPGTAWRAPRTSRSESGGERRTHVVVVYDTDADHNAAILRTCRKYLHHVQRSIFEGQLSTA
ncbi:CRISPR-associated endonuclease Cas2 [Streptomyces otsuchiensis]|uniref:CRISPR-associated endonuclease Cas2 n=1 Tax=Streptomyces otsuchiensis TaxID=2681388 RepID=UPI0010325612|nr:CRISPR-associated endonuclease Cas2 [Streptomyces otsuchiensis]